MNRGHITSTGCGMAEVRRRRRHAWPSYSSGGSPPLPLLQRRCGRAAPFPLQCGGRRGRAAPLRCGGRRKSLALSPRCCGVVRFPFLSDAAEQHRLPVRDADAARESGADSRELFSSACTRPKLLSAEGFCLCVIWTIGSVLDGDEEPKVAT